jgi:hypothetical protein
MSWFIRCLEMVHNGPLLLSAAERYRSCHWLWYGLVKFIKQLWQMKLDVAGALEVSAALF